jgi:thiamine-phosphate pyrophosphorylase
VVKRPAPDLRVYLVTDRALCLGRDLLEVVVQAVLGGVGAVQLREKCASFEEFVALGLKVKDVLDSRNIPLIINDRVDVALAVGARGVHLGQGDIDSSLARRLLGPAAIIGLSVENLEQVRAAEHLDIDYLGLSPVFATPTKPEADHPWGLEGVRRVRETSRHRLVGIGSIGPGNAAAVIKAGAHGVAVVSAICSAPDPCRTALELRRAVESAQKASSP